jgi:hypothetical protein
MLNRRAFLQTALLGGGAFGLGVKLGLGNRCGAGPRLVLHGFLPDDDATVRAAVSAFLAATPGRLPAPVLDVTPRLRGAVAAGLRTRLDDYDRGNARLLSVQVTDLAAGGAAADVLLQNDGRILDPASQFGRELLALRCALLGRPAAIAFTARLEDRAATTRGGLVLVVENERGLQDRLALQGDARTMTFAGPAGRTVVEFGDQGVRVAEASCRHRICQLQGAAARAGEMIACAPNRLLLRVESA